MVDIAPADNQEEHTVPMDLINTSRHWLLRVWPQFAVACAVVLRLAVSLFTGDPYDFEIWKTTNSWLYVLGFNPLVWWTQGPLGLLLIVWPYTVYESFRLWGRETIYLQHFVLHLPMIAGDALMFVALYRLGIHLTRDRYVACATGFAWLLNPFTFWISAVHGHFDQMMMALAILGLDLLTRGKDFRAGLCISASIATKYVTVLLLPSIAVYMILRRRSFMAFLNGCIAGFFIFLAPFLSVFLVLSPNGSLQLIKERLWWTGIVNSERTVIMQGDLYRASVMTPYSALVHAGLADFLSVDWLIRLPTLLLGITGLLLMFGLLCGVRRTWRERAAMSPADALEKANVVALVLTAIVVGYSPVNVIQRLSYVLPFLIIDAWIFRKTRETAIVLLSGAVLLPLLFEGSPFWYILATQKGTALSLVGWWNTLPMKSRLLAASAGYVYSMLLICLGWSGLNRLMGYALRPISGRILWSLWSLYATMACSGVLFAWHKVGIFALACITLVIGEQLIWSARRVICTAHLLPRLVVLHLVFVYSILAAEQVILSSAAKAGFLVIMTIIWFILVQSTAVRRNQEQPMGCRLGERLDTYVRGRICCYGS